MEAEEGVRRDDATRPGCEASADGFEAQVPDFYFENRHQTPGAPPEGNKAQPRKFYDLIIATNRIHSIVKLFSRHKFIEQLWLHLNPNYGVLVMVTWGTPMGFEAIAYARSTILEKLIKDRLTEESPKNQEDLSTHTLPSVIGPTTAPTRRAGSAQE
ncbi:hypothetical protein HOY80DRAFT_1100840 [Tuber brumale]|nr:hypothetical protein HOY80DRAFT_1100840 [Tuber brumale]